MLLSEGNIGIYSARKLLHPDDTTDMNQEALPYVLSQNIASVISAATEGINVQKHSEFILEQYMFFLLATNTVKRLEPARNWSY